MGSKNSRPKSALQFNTNELSPSINVLRQCTRQNVIVIWFCEDTNKCKADCQHMLNELNQINVDMKVFHEPDEFVDSLTDIDNHQVFLIISSRRARQLLPHIHSVPQLISIYIYNNYRTRTKSWTPEWSKIKGMYVPNDVIQALKLVIQPTDQQSNSIHSLIFDRDNLNTNGNQLDSSHMYTQLFKSIFLSMEHDPSSYEKLLIYWRNLYTGHPAELQIIDEFERDYSPDKAIFWYTRESFIYPLVNRALRLLDADVIVNMSVFICDLHRQIEKLFQEQISQYGDQPFLVYRGQKLTMDGLTKLQKAQGGLISFSNFLSTSKSQDIALCLAISAADDLNEFGVFYIIRVDPRNVSTPFADIHEFSHFENEEEFLFSMHAVFSVGKINRINNNDRLFEVHLTLTVDDDEELRTLTDQFRNEAQDSTSWNAIGTLLIRIGYLEKAEELYHTLLEKNDEALYHHQLGYINNLQGRHTNAVRYYKKAIDMLKGDPRIDHLQLARSFNGLGLVYSNKGDYPKALTSLRKALSMRQKALPEDHIDLASSYGNIGSIQHKMGDYSKALVDFEKSLNIYQQHLPKNHPVIGTCYSNIASLYDQMGHSAKASEFYRETIDIRQKTLPPDHPDLATSYNGIGLVYYKMKQYSKALSLYEKALKIQLKSLDTNHPFIINSYNNLGLVHSKMGHHLKALSLFEVVLNADQTALSSNQMYLACSHNNIGLIHFNMQNYAQALSSYKKAVEIYEKLGLESHPDLANSYNNIAAVHFNLEEFSKALSFFQKALHIWERVLPPKHTNIKTVNVSIKTVSKKL